VRVLCVTVTEAGRVLARRLPYEQAHGDLAATVRARWAEVDAFVLFAAVGVAVRVAGPLLADKRTDPAVVAVDEAGRFAVAVAGGHAGGANRLARRWPRFWGPPRW
jgi:cobalt-precorrin 5A hydrolase/precorrin-3B C17-methyltransferase